jgi:hypothetical protein
MTFAGTRSIFQSLFTNPAPRQNEPFRRLSFLALCLQISGSAQPLFGFLTIEKAVLTKDSCYGAVCCKRCCPEERTHTAEEVAKV